MIWSTRQRQFERSQKPARISLNGRDALCASDAFRLCARTPASNANQRRVDTGDGNAEWCRASGTNAPLRRSRIDYALIVDVPLGGLQHEWRWVMLGPAEIAGALALTVMIVWLVWAGLTVVRYTKTSTKLPHCTPDPASVRQTRSGAVIGWRSGGNLTLVGHPLRDGGAARRSAVHFPSWTGTWPALATSDRPLQFERSGIRAARALGIPRHLARQGIGSESCLTCELCARRWKCPVGSRCR